MHQTAGERFFSVAIGKLRPNGGGRTGPRTCRVRGSLPSGAVIPPRCSCASAEPMKLGGVVGWLYFMLRGLGAMEGTSLGEGAMMRGLPSACVAETMLGGCGHGKRPRPL